MNTSLTFVILSFFFLQTKIRNIYANPINNSLLPSTELCGIGSISNRILGGHKTDIDEFPWMALLHYESKNGNHYLSCGGVLINDRYVLTAAHCVKGRDIPHSRILNSVRLGEYNIETDVDCVETKCAPAAINVPIEEKIVHERFNPNDRNNYYDIALLRLAKRVTFTRFIMPICLPTTAFEQSKDYIDKKLTVAGWGHTENGTTSKIKLKVAIPVKSNKVCLTVYGSILNRVQITDEQLCAGGDEKKDSCRGDSGGSLMSYSLDEQNQPNWYTVGIVSLGPKDCGIKDWPGIYTRVANYVPWIMSKLKT